MSEKIALGLGDNVDYEILWDRRVLEDLVIRYDIREGELSADRPVAGERDLVVSCLGFLKEGKGGERFVASPELLESFSGRFRKKITLGGTSVRAAIAMRKLGYTSALHLVTINDHVRRLLPEGCPYVCSSRTDSTYPHLIVQFDRGARVKAGDIDLCASRSNRIIYENDADNIRMELNEEFSDLLSEARVFLISGFNAVQSAEVLDARLKTLLRILGSLSAEARVFYEDACFYNPAFSRKVREALNRRIDLYSMNEDEMQEYLGRRVDLLDAAQVGRALLEIRSLIPVPLIVVHTRYWALACGRDAGKMAGALKGGITMATTRLRSGDDFTAEDYRRTEQSPIEPEGETFSEEIGRLLGDRVCCLPSVKEDVEKATTIGLGDAFVGGFLPRLLG